VIPIQSEHLGDNVRLEARAFAARASVRSITHPFNDVLDYRAYLWYNKVTAFSAVIIMEDAAKSLYPARMAYNGLPKRTRD
jgi:hypothetical protein